MHPAVRLLLTLIAAAIGGVIGLAAAGSLATGIANLFLFGSEPWPAWGQPAVSVIAALAGALLAWRAGRSVWLALDKAVKAGNTPR